MKLFNRVVRFTAIGSSGLAINFTSKNTPQIKIAFSVAKTLEGEQNEATVTLYNLSDGTRFALGKELQDVRLDAGYESPDGGSNVATILMGQIRDVKHERQGTDLATTLTVGEGEKANRKATVSKTMPKGTEIEAIVEEVFKGFEEYEIERGEWKFPDDMEPTKRPYSMYGAARLEMDRLGATHEFYWMINAGKFEICPGDGYFETGIRLDASSGLIDVPAVTDNGCNFTAMLNPEIQPGREVQIISTVQELNASDGRYRVSACTYSGDNYTGEFVVSGECEAIEGGKVDEGED